MHTRVLQASMGHSQASQVARVAYAAAIPTAATLQQSCAVVFSCTQYKGQPWGSNPKPNSTVSIAVVCCAVQCSKRDAHKEMYNLHSAFAAQQQPSLTPPLPKQDIDPDATEHATVHLLLSANTPSGIKLGPCTTDVPAGNMLLL